jgi:hypothetical protein
MRGVGLVHRWMDPTKGDTGGNSEVFGDFDGEK